MRRSALAALLALATMGLATGCQSPQAKQAARQESKQEQLQLLKTQMGALMNTYMTDCPLDPQTDKPSKSPKCVEEDHKSTVLTKQIHELQREIASE